MRLSNGPFMQRPCRRQHIATRHMFTVIKNPCTNRNTKIFGRFYEMSQRVQKGYNPKLLGGLVLELIKDTKEY